MSYLQTFAVYAAAAGPTTTTVLLGLLLAVVSVLLLAALSFADREVNKRKSAEAKLVANELKWKETLSDCTHVRDGLRRSLIKLVMAATRHTALPMSLTASDSATDPDKVRMRMVFGGENGVTVEFGMPRSLLRDRNTEPLVFDRAYRLYGELEVSDEPCSTTTAGD